MGGVATFGGAGVEETAGFGGTGEGEADTFGGAGAGETGPFIGAEGGAGSFTSGIGVSVWEGPPGADGLEGSFRKGKKTMRPTTIATATMALPTYHSTLFLENCFLGGTRGGVFCSTFKGSPFVTC